MRLEAMMDRYRGEASQEMVMELDIISRRGGGVGGRDFNRLLIAKLKGGLRQAARPPYQMIQGVLNSVMTKVPLSKQVALGYLRYLSAGPAALHWTTDGFTASRDEPRQGASWLHLYIN
ncbi:hypothetical protein E2C01_085699 [Portunus trituberculatus]|uniref:Uncharacterized protein n=1 Tax=Portunus trituberculatus TaxID=210409 RepID=A0A5B7J3G3_PORTR|nr:hypothetical protein [Portunus trituberculatus]